MIKKLLIACCAVALLAACDGQNTTADNNDSADNKPATEVVTPPADNAAQADAAAVNPNGFPSGDIKADAVAIAQATVAQSKAMQDNSVNEAEQKKLQKMFDEAAKFYDAQGKSAEFSKLVSEEMTKQLTALKAELNKE